MACRPQLLKLIVSRTVGFERREMLNAENSSLSPLFRCPTDTGYVQAEHDPAHGTQSEA
jgi:hypothetical protein